METAHYTLNQELIHLICKVVCGFKMEKAQSSHLIKQLLLKLHILKCLDFNVNFLQDLILSVLITQYLHGERNKNVYEVFLVQSSRLIYIFLQKICFLLLYYILKTHSFLFFFNLFYVLFSSFFLGCEFKENLTIIQIYPGYSYFF